MWRLEVRVRMHAVMQTTAKTLMVVVAVEGTAAGAGTGVGAAGASTLQIH